MSVPKLRFPEFKDAGEWEVIPLGMISDRIIDKVGTEVLPSVSISAGFGFVSQFEKFGRDISGEQYKNYIVLSEGEFAYNKGNSKRYPQGSIYKLVEFKRVASPNAFICFRLKLGYIADFLKQYFEFNAHGSQLKKFITSGARSDGLLNIKPDDFFSISFAIPKKNEQQKIADCLSSLDDLIAAHNQKLFALKTHKKGLMQQLFPAEGESVPRLRFKEFRDKGEWEETTLEKVVGFENGKAHENNVVDLGPYILVNSKFISTDGEIRKYSDKCFCPTNINDLLMVMSDVPNGRAIAKCFLVDSDDRYTVNQRICKLTPNGVVPKLLFFILDRNSFYLSFDDGVKQTNLRKEDVLNCPLLIPVEAQEQQKISDFLSFLDNLISAQAQKIEALKLHKKGLMQQLFPQTEEAKR
ncbi:MAG: hypothetical protein A2Y38_24295 [Spirochaetes bacterium GWB1_59_5]|nr:MAG: hypothetical protein A2Y38_24295 [Spirochaetes bacterium GWB1_59_5]